MKSVDTIINEALTSTRGNAVQVAVNHLLGEDIEHANGSTVAIIDDPTYAQPGVTGKCKGASAKGSGFVDVELPNGVVVPMQSSLLLKVD